MAKNRVKFGFEELHYALETSDDVYGEWKEWPGAVSCEREPNSEQSNFYADDMNYYVVSVDNGYNYTLTTAMIPEEVEQEVLGDAVDEETGIMTESRDSTVKRIALGYAIKGDVQKRKFVDYGVILSRPTTSAETTTESAEPQTDEISATCVGLRNKPATRIKTSSTTSEEILNKWWDKVIMPGEYEELKGA